MYTKVPNEETLIRRVQAVISKEPPTAQDMVRSGTHASFFADSATTNKQLLAMVHSTSRDVGYIPPYPVIDALLVEWAVLANTRRQSAMLAVLSAQRSVKLLASVVAARLGGRKEKKAGFDEAELIQRSLSSYHEC